MILHLWSNETYPSSLVWCQTGLGHREQKLVLWTIPETIILPVTLHNQRHDKPQSNKLCFALLYIVCFKLKSSILHWYPKSMPRIRWSYYDFWFESRYRDCFFLRDDLRSKEKTKWWIPFGYYLYVTKSILFDFLNRAFFLLLHFIHMPE